MAAMSSSASVISTVHRTMVKLVLESGYLSWARARRCKKKDVCRFCATGHASALESAITLACELVSDEAGMAACSRSLSFPFIVARLLSATLMAVGAFDPKYQHRQILLEDPQSQRTPNDVCPVTPLLRASNLQRPHASMRPTKMSGTAALRACKAALRSFNCLRCVCALLSRMPPSLIPFSSEKG